MAEDCKPGCNPETKPVLTSKLNWMGFIIVILAAITDPSFQVLFGDLIPPAVFSKLMFVAGFSVIGLRTLGKTMPLSFNWKTPFKQDEK